MRRREPIGSGVQTDSCGSTGQGKQTQCAKAGRRFGIPRCKQSQGATKYLLIQTVSCGHRVMAVVRWRGISTLERLATRWPTMSAW